MCECAMRGLGFHRLRSTLGCRGAKAGLLAAATSDPPSAFIFGQTVRPPGGAKGTTHGLNCGGCVNAASLANAAALLLKGQRLWPYGY